MLLDIGTRVKTFPDFNVTRFVKDLEGYLISGNSPDLCLLLLLAVLTP